MTSLKNLRKLKQKIPTVTLLISFICTGTECAYGCTVPYIWCVCVSVQSACSYFLVRPGNSEIILPFRALLPSLFSPNPLQISLMPYSVRLVRARFTFSFDLLFARERLWNFSREIIKFLHLVTLKIRWILLSVEISPKWKFNKHYIKVKY